MIITSDQLYTTVLTNNPYFILQETFSDRVTYRVAWAARLANGKIVNQQDWCYLSGEYPKPQQAQRRLPAAKKANERSLEIANES